jgi:signal transduction histidine kinase
LLLEGLVLNTNAVLDIRKLHLMDGYSALAVAAQLLLLAGLLFWHRSTLRYWSPLSSGRSEPFAWTMAATGAGLAVWAVVFWKLDRDWLGLAIWGLVWAAVAVARRKPAKEVQGGGYLVWLGLLAAIPALVLHFSLRAKERDMRRLYAYELVSDQDGLFEYLALQSVARIQADPKVQAFFKKQSPQLGALKKHLRRYYFDGYMSRYQLEVFSRPAASFPLLEWLNQRFGGSYQPVGSRNLYFLNDFTQLATYYLRLPRPDSLTASGVEEFILRFTPESQTRSSIFTELLFGRNPSKRERFPDYEYALYSEGVLSQKQGYYPYPLQLPAHQAAGEYRMYERNGYSHLLYQITPTTTAIVSLELNGLIGSLASFSALLLMLSVLSGLGYLLGRVQWRGKRPAWKALPLRMQIRMSLIGLSAISMAVVYIATATYLTNDYNESERQRLIDQLLQAEKRLSSSGPTPWSSDSAREALTRQLKDIARSLETEINFYAPNGRLLASSQPGLVEQGVLPQRMSHEAKARTRARAVSHTVVQERIGKLAFLAGYRPIAERGGRPPAYLSVPFYSKEIRLQQELTAVIVSLLNWYLLAFAGVMLVSFTLSETITRPLQLIGERLRAVDLDQGLQPIHWESQDELGRLVANYNAMIGELQKSAQKLAEKERQQAWQGMARQVAHEIKNPLTPMKLQLQQLRMAQQRDPDALLHRFPKVSDMLIRQIDQLSRIATEFSHFAKMPQGEMQWLDLRTSLGDIEQLYTNEEGARLYVEPPEAALWVWADPSHISRLLTNLVKNAFQAVADKEGVEPWVRVRAYPSGEKIYLEVADNGVGIEAGQLQWIFQPTFSTKSSGMGLGLSMCKQIVHLSGGTIEARSEPGQGTVFEVVFPRGKVSGESLPSPPQRAGEKLS